MTTQRILKATVAALCVWTWTTVLCAQSPTGRIEGIITDDSGGVISGARVTVANQQTGVQHETTANSVGYYAALLLPPGEYEVTAEKSGFQRTTRSDVRLEVDQVAKVDLTLQIGAVTEVVEVTDQAPLLQTSTSSVGQVIDNEQIMNLPLNTRTALGLIGLSPGVNVGRNFDANQYNRANQFSASGSRPGQNEFLLDGAPNTLPGVYAGRGILGVAVPVDSIQEFKVQTNAFSAEFGRSGGGLINTVTKSGSNQLHGSLFDYLRNSKMDANNFFANAAGVPLGSFKRNQFGGTVGGPIARNRTFFFVNYQGTRARTASNKKFTVPTPEMKTGDFSELSFKGKPVTIYDPLTTHMVNGQPIRTPFPRNLIPADRINPVGTFAVAKYPDPNQTGFQNNLVLSGSSEGTGDIVGVRVDHRIAANHQVFGRYYYTRNDSVSPNWYQSEATPGKLGQLQDVHSLSLDYIYTVNPTTIFNARYGYTIRKTANLSRAVGVDLTHMGFPAYVQNQNGQTTYPAFSVSGYGSQGWDQGINAFDYITQSIQASMTKVMGSHTLKFGADVRFARVPQDRGINLSGNYGFNTGFTRGPNANKGSANAGDSIASLLLGIPSGGNFGTFLQIEGKNSYSGFYAQDDWRVSHALTLNIGLRYEIELPRTERLDRLDWFDFNAVSPLNNVVEGLGTIHGGLRFVGIDGNSRRQFDTDWNNFGPRLGFAYQLNPQTVVRGGAGMFYGSGSVGAGGWNIASGGYAPSTPYVGSLDGLVPITTLSDPFPDGFTQAIGNSQGLLTQAGQSIPRVFDRNAPLPYNLQWNLSVERRVGQMLVEAAYIASRGVHLGDGAGHEINQLFPELLELGTQLQKLVPNPFYGIIKNPGPLSKPKVTQGQLLRPYPQFTNMTIFNPAAGSSTYHGFTVKIERRFASGLGFLVSYTTSKNLSDAPATIGPKVRHQDAYNRRADRSLVEEDIAQRFVASGIWELPFGRAKPIGANWGPVLNAIAGGWQMNAIVGLQSGPPLGITNSPNTSKALGGLQRPNSNGFSAARTGPVQDRLGNFLDETAFSRAPAFTYGNVGRLLPDVRGPRSSNVDLAFVKSFRIKERYQVNFRGELFNAFNTPVFGLPNTAFGGRKFGQINSQQNAPRQVQLALRFTF